jgi:site-specific DNA-methyltransferase (adenine-specific)
MRYLCRLVTPPGGTVLDPFAGSGSTGKAAILEGFSFIGCEMTPEYIPIAEARLAHALAKYLAAQSCRRCDNTGDIHRADGAYVGPCDCGAPSLLTDPSPLATP